MIISATKNCAANRYITLKKMLSLLYVLASRTGFQDELIY